MGARRFTVSNLSKNAIDMEKDKDANIKPESWEGWFIADTISLKAKAGLGFSFGGSYFKGRTLPSSVSSDKENLFNPVVYKKLFEEAADKTD